MTAKSRARKMAQKLNRKKASSDREKDGSMKLLKRRKEQSENNE